MVKEWIKVLFDWFDANPASYWVIAAVPAMVLAAWVTAGLLRRDPGTYARKSGEAAFVLLILGVLLAGRWPYLLAAHDFNPDESQLIAGAITLKHDFVFWRSVDGTTSGPLNFYALLPTHLLGVPQDYFNARLTGLLLIWGALTAAYVLLRSAYGPPIARLGILPGVVFFSAATDGDFVQYSSNDVSIFIIAIACWLLWRHRAPPDGWTRSLPESGWIGAGVFIGLLPWAKLQTLPFAGILFGWAAWHCFKNRGLAMHARLRRAGWFAIAAALPSVVAFIVIVVAGQWEHFFRSYIAHNFTYVAMDQGVARAVRELTRLSLFTWHYPAFLAGPVLVVLCGAFAVWGARRTSPLYLLGCLLTFAACVTILSPRRGNHHYLLYLVVPMTFWAAAALGELWRMVGSEKGRLGLAAGFACVCLALPLGNRLRLPVPAMFGQFAEHWRHPHTDAGRIIRRLAEAGDRLAVWGWHTRLYVDSALPQATREAHTHSQIEESPQRDYLRERYMADLRRNQPRFFADAVGPEAFAYIDRSREGHETFPELKDYIRGNYRLLTDTGQVRIYVLRRPGEDFDDAF